MVNIWGDSVATASVAHLSRKEVDLNQDTTENENKSSEKDESTKF